MDSKYYSIAAEVEDTHWWFSGRRNVLKKILDNIIPKAKAVREILDIGCGNGGNLSLLSGYGKLFAVELDAGARERANKRNLALVEKGSLPNNIPFKGMSFDIITAFDVLEHVEDELNSLQLIRSRLKNDGILVLTVPAYNFMWTSNDVYSHHKRRYTRSQITTLLIDNGFEVFFSSYFNVFLFPFALIYLLFEKIHKGVFCRALRIPPWPINNLFLMIFSLERWIILNTKIPFGMSIVICAKLDLNR